jgi:hypothetical protein
MQYLINYFVTAFVVYLLNYFFYLRSQPFHIRRLNDTLRHSVFHIQNESSINIRSRAMGEIHLKGNQLGCVHLLQRRTVVDTVTNLQVV